MEENSNHTFFLLFEQCKTPAVPQPYRTLLNSRKPHSYLSRALLFFYFQQYKIPAVTYFNILNKLKP